MELSKHKVGTKLTTGNSAGNSNRENYLPKRTANPVAAFRPDCEKRKGELGPRGNKVPRKHACRDQTRGERGKRQRAIDLYGAAKASQRLRLQIHPKTRPQPIRVCRIRSKGSNPNGFIPVGMEGYNLDQQ